MLHDKPTNTAERLALHLETNYGLQLDAFRHSALVGEIKEFLETYTGRYLAAHQDAPQLLSGTIPSASFNAEVLTLSGYGQSLGRAIEQAIPAPMGAVVALEESEPEKTNG
jgi:hypothetical protein